MKNKIKKAFSLISAVAMSAVSLSSVIPAYAVSPSDMIPVKTTTFPYIIEGEDIKGAQLWTSIYEKEIPDYSGKGFAYLTGDALSFKVTVKEDGMYNISARIAQILDNDSRVETISINGAEYSKNVPYTDKWTDFDFGTVRLTAGENEISFLNKYGYIAIDTITVSVAEKKDYSIATSETCDPDATPETKSLMKYLKSIYGEHTIAGQQEIYGGGHNGNYEWENEYLEKLTGKVPAIRGLDFMNYNPLYGWDDGSTERAIEWVKERNGIITASWHINVPIDFDNYEVGDEVDWKNCSYANYQKSGSTFNTANVLKEGTKEREYFEEAMKMLAEQLQKLQDENVPIIFRPLHEAQGNEGNYGDGTSWFWWGDRGSEVYKELWKLLYTTLTEKYELHNIIWEFNSYDYSNSHTWYPGDEYVDIVAYDKYNVEYNRGDGKSSGPNLRAVSEKFDYLFKLTKGTKMVSMAENDTIPALDNILVEDANWLYFCPWYDGGEDGGTAFLGENYQDHEELIKMYQSEYCITLDELPENLYSFEYVEPPKTTTTTTTKTTATTTTTAKTTKTTTSKTYETETTTTTTTILPETEVTFRDIIAYVGEDYVKFKDNGIYYFKNKKDMKPFENLGIGTPVAVDFVCREERVVSYYYSVVTSGNRPKYGDSNDDGEINIADAVLIMQSLSNPDEYTLTEQTQLNADVVNFSDGVTAMDALAIQLIGLNMISAEDFPITTEKLQSLIN